MAFMSEWYFTEIATVYPRLTEGDWGSGIAYGTPYTIMCGFEGVSRQSRDQEGAEFVTRDIYYTGDERPVYLDRIAFGDTSGSAWDTVSASEIRKRARHGMSAFGYDDEFDLETA